MQRTHLHFMTAVALALGVALPASSQTIFLTEVASLNRPTGIGYHCPTDTLIASVNWNNGQPHNLMRVGKDGSTSQFSSLSGGTSEVKVAEVPLNAKGGFTNLVGNIFCGNGRDGEIVRISNNGATVENPWTTFPLNGTFRGGLHVDDTGNFGGGDLIAAATNGEIWRCNHLGGNQILVADIDTTAGGVVTVPDNDSKYGPLSGRILVGGFDNGLIYAIDPSGNVVAHDFGLGASIEDIDIIDDTTPFYGLDFANDRMLTAAAGSFTGMHGCILVTREEGFGASGLYVLDIANGTATELGLAPGSESTSQWEHVTFTSPECLLVIGDSAGSSAFLSAGHVFTTQVGPDVEDFHGLLLDVIPEFVLPIQSRRPFSGQAGVKGGSTFLPIDVPEETPDWMHDMSFTVQVLMWNPDVFPGQPEQYSAGLQVTLLPNGGVATTPYGSDLGGIEVWAETDVNEQGQRVIRFPFSIPGMSAP